VDPGRLDLLRGPLAARAALTHMLSLPELASKNDVTDTDNSNGYEAVAEYYIGHRTQRSVVGVEIIGKWARSLPLHASVLDLGCGPGAPLSQILIDHGCRVYGLDASSTMIAAFRARFPDAPAECASVLESTFFDRSFDGVLAWGLMFLLGPQEQERLIRKVAAALEPGGQFVFTSPWQRHEWNDSLTKRRSYSVGAAEYRRFLEEAGLQLLRDDIDDGDNYYYFAQRSITANRGRRSAEPALEPTAIFNAFCGGDTDS